MELLIPLFIGGVFACILLSELYIKHKIESKAVPYLQTVHATFLYRSQISFIGKPIIRYLYFRTDDGKKLALYCSLIDYRHAGFFRMPLKKLSGMLSYQDGYFVEFNMQADTVQQVRAKIISIEPLSLPDNSAGSGRFSVNFAAPDGTQKVFALKAEQLGACREGDTGILQYSDVHFLRFDM